MIYKQKTTLSHEWINTLLSAIGIIIALSTFIFGYYYQALPQKQPGNDNIIAKANAGDTNSQLFLAHHYYEIGDIKESIYWYKIASLDKRNINYAAALNNLALLYLDQEYLPVKKGNHYHEIERSLFTLSAKNGSPVGRKNLYLLLVSTPEELWTEINYSQELAHIKDLLREKHEWSDELARFESGWEYVENTEGIDYSSNEEYTVIHVPGAPVTGITESGGEIVIPTYRSEVYRKIQPVPDPEFHYQDLLDIGINVESNTLSETKK